MRVVEFGMLICRTNVVKCKGPRAVERLIRSRILVDHLQDKRDLNGTF